VRAAALGVVPGKDWFHFGVEPPKAHAPVATEFPAIEPVQPAAPMLAADQPGQTIAAQPLAPSAVPIQYVQGTVGVPVAMRPGVVTVYQLPAATPAVTRSTPIAAASWSTAAGRWDYSPLPPIEQGALAQLASLSPTSHPHAVTNQSLPAAPVPPINSGIDRWQLSTWALLRSQQTGVAGSQSLASIGQLGASQAGARLLYNINRQIGLAARVSTPVGKRGGEVAAGVRIHPLVNIPIWLTAERRQAIGQYGGGRNDFALFVEGGVYDQPLPWRFLLDTYFQGGVVGIKSHDLFVDGALTITRPVYRNFSAGFGVWGGAQPGLSRVDVGPRVTMRVRKNVRVHLDWRQKLVGNARPGSGPALTLAGDF
jgi:hypothetical protein